MFGFLHALMASIRNDRHSGMARLAHDVRGNTLAMMAIAMIPLIGLVGSGVDLSRLYIVKTRLQHACDAGALTGRKTMGGGTFNQTVNGVANYPQVAANRFFDANIQATPYGATGLTRNFTESAGKVTGTASATVGMTLMRLFGQPSVTLNVTCDAEMRLPNTDVMFVLDTTGSMNSKAVSTDTLTKIQSLRIAVKCFYETVARLDTDADCTTGTPSGGTSSNVQIRFGFVPYATNVNVGRLLPTSFFADSWPYQSRQAVFVDTPTTTWNDTGSATATGDDISSTSNISGQGWTDVSTGNAPNSSSCSNLNTPDDSDFNVTSEGSPTNYQYGSGNPRTVTYDTSISGTYYKWRYTWTSGTCKLQKRLRNFSGTRHYSKQQAGTVTTVKTFDHFHYGQITQDIRGLKNGTAWNTSFTVPIGTGGNGKSISWDGCIEERHTVRQTSFSTIPADADDLQIDEMPNAGDPDSLWGPALPGMIYMRNSPTYAYNTDPTYWTTAESDYNGDYDYNPSYSCPSESRKLQAWSNPQDFDNYVDGITVGGNTYHDIGLLWGGRLMSPTGIFASENAYTPQGGEIERHMIFMTDGDTNAINTDYAAYGLPWFDRRQTDPSSVPSNTDLNNQVNARFLALCTAIKNKNITLWVISFGTGSNSTTENRLSQCATTGRYFSARDSATLQATFASIADQISQLRLTK